MSDEHKKSKAEALVDLIHGIITAAGLEGAVTVWGEGAGDVWTRIRYFNARLAGVVWFRAVVRFLEENHLVQHLSVSKPSGTQECNMDCENCDQDGEPSGRNDGPTKH
jgi:hypothetical protein